MNHIQPLIASIFLFCMISSCETMDTIETIDELTVHAYLHGGLYLDTVFFGKITPLDSSQAVPDILEPVIVAENGEEFPLFYTGNDGGYVHPDLLISPDQSYKLVVPFNGKNITAETYIPPKPRRLRLSRSIIRRTKIRDFTDIQGQEIPDPVALSWEGEAGDFYFVEVQNIENDPEPINELFANGAGPPIPEFLTEPSASLFYDINAFRDITHYGTHEVRVYRVNPEYVAIYESNTSGTGSLNEIRTNVQNGFGIFTGINSDKIRFEVVKQ